MCLFTGVNRCVYTFIGGVPSPGWRTQSALLNVPHRCPERSNTYVCGYACFLLLDDGHQTTFDWLVDPSPANGVRHGLKWWVRGFVSYRPTQNTIWYVSSYSCFKRLCSFIWTASARSSVEQERPPRVRPGFPRQSWHLKVTLRLCALSCEFTSFSFQHVSLWPPEHVINPPPVHLRSCEELFQFIRVEKEHSSLQQSTALVCPLAVRTNTSLLWL